MLNHKTEPNKFKFEILSNVFSDHNGMKTEVRKKFETHKYVEFHAI